MTESERIQKSHNLQINAACCVLRDRAVKKWDAARMVNNEATTLAQSLKSEALQCAWQADVYANKLCEKYHPERRGSLVWPVALRTPDPTP